MGWVLVCVTANDIEWAPWYHGRILSLYLLACADRRLFPGLSHAFAAAHTCQLMCMLDDIYLMKRNHLGIKLIQHMHNLVEKLPMSR